MSLTPVPEDFCLKNKQYSVCQHSPLLFYSEINTTIRRMKKRYNLVFASAGIKTESQTANVGNHMTLTVIIYGDIDIIY